VREFSVYQRIGGILSGGQSSVESGYLGGNVGNVLEKSTMIIVSMKLQPLERICILWLAISEDVHDYIKGDCLIRFWEKRCLINRN